MFSPASTSDFFHSLAKKYMPQPQTMQAGGVRPGMTPGGPMSQVGSYAQTFQQGSPFQGYNGGGSFGSSNPWGRSAGGYDPAQEAKASSGDRYAHLTEDPFAKGPGGFLNIQG